MAGVIAIDALRDEYPLNELLNRLALSKSSYFYQRTIQTKPDKYASLRTAVNEVLAESQSRYGYRRIHARVKNKGISVLEKVVRRIMKVGLLSRQLSM